MVNPVDMARRQRALADFGEFALGSEDLDAVLAEACRLVGSALGTSRAKVLEIQEGGQELLVRAGVGWRPDIVGKMRLSMADASSETFAIRAGRPIITQDIGSEQRFDIPAFMRAEGVQALANVPILLPGRRPYGILQVDSTQPRAFTGEDTEFLRTYATILGPVVDRLQAVHRLRLVEEREREREIRFRTIFDSAPVGLSIIEADGRFRRVNGELARILGRTAEELTTLSVAEVTAAEDVPRAASALAKSLMSGGSVSLDKLYLRPDGGLVHANSTLTRLPLAEGTPAIVAVTVDLSARHRAERALRDNEERHRKELERQIREATQELRAGRDLLKATMDASNDMIQVFSAVRDAEGRIVDFQWILNNHASEMRYGEVRGESLLTRNPGVIVEGIFDSFKRVCETGIPEQAERRYAHEQFDGWFFQTVVKLNDGVATTTTDITERQQAQAEILRLRDEAAAASLRASEERFLSFAENATDALWIVEAGTMTPIYVSPAFERIWAIGRQDVLGDPARWAARVHPQDRARVRDALSEALAGQSLQVVYRIEAGADGQLQWIEDTIFPIRDASGAVAHAGGISQDVTEQRRTAEHLRDNQRRLWTVIQGIPQLVWRSTNGGEWTWASPQWSAFTGQSGQDAAGFGWIAMLHPDDRALALAGWKDVDGQSPLAMETRLFDARERRYRWFQTRALPVKDDEGEVVEWLGTSTDIDDLRQLQERQSVLVAELQHRTRNLLSVVRGIMEQTAATSPSQDAFMSAFRERLAALSRINGLLARLEKGQRVTFDTLLRTELEARGALGDGVSHNVRLFGSDGVRLRSATVQTLALAIHELTTNAVKYGALSGRGGTLSIEWRVVDDDGEPTLHVEWRESGVADMPDPDAAPRGGGHGRMLIERALPYQLGARTSYRIGADGVACTLDLPLNGA